MAKAQVLIDKTLHQQLKAKLRNCVDMTIVVSRLVEMYLRGEVKVTIPEKQL